MNTNVSANKEMIGVTDNAFSPVVNDFLQAHPDLLAQESGAPYEKTIRFWTAINTLLTYRKQEEAGRLICMYFGETFMIRFHSFIANR